MAARTCTFHIQNKMPIKLLKGAISLDHGIWTDDMTPPDPIPAGETMSFRAESNGLLTGTAGTISYTVLGYGTFTLHWSIPYDGANSYSPSSHNEDGGQPWNFNAHPLPGSHADDATWNVTVSPG